MKIDIDLIKTFLNLLTFYIINSMEFTVEFLTLMRFCLLQGYIRQGPLKQMNGIAPNGLEIR